MEPEEVRQIIKTALNVDKLVSLDVVEFNKDLGDAQNSLLAVQRVFELESMTESDDDTGATM